MSSSIYLRRATGWVPDHLPLLLLVLAIAIVAAVADRAGAEDQTPGAEPGLVLRGGEDGTAFRSLTVEGEDRIHIDYERPPLVLALSPETAPGLDWGGIEDVLDRSFPDLNQPLFVVSASAPCPYLGRPWLAEFATGPVAVFRPAVEGVDRWRLEVVDGRGAPVAVYEGSGRPPREIAWDGRVQGGTIAVPGRTYSYVFTSLDRAGNKRTIVGDGFDVPAHRGGEVERPVFIMGGADLQTDGRSDVPVRRAAPNQVPPALIEVASWINQITPPSTPVRVTVMARSDEQASALVAQVGAILADLIPAGSTRIQGVKQVELDAPPAGVVTITTQRPQASRES